MTEPAPHAKQAAPRARPTVFGIIARYGHRVGDRVHELVQLAAAAQAERHPRGDVAVLTRSTALWAILHLDPEIARAVEKSRVTEADLGRALELDAPEPALVEDVEVYEELARALDTYCRAAAPSRAIGLVDIAIAVLRDVEAHGGRLGERLRGAGADVPDALERLRRLEYPAALSGSSTEPSGAVSRGPRADASGAVGRRPQADAGGTIREAVPVGVSEAAVLYLRFYEALRVPSEAPDGDGGEIDGRALWAAFGLVAFNRRGTLATVVARAVLRLRDTEASTDGPLVGLFAFGIDEDTRPVPGSEVDVAGHPLVARAAAVRDRVEPDEGVHLRHLVAVAIRHGSGPLGPDTRAGDVIAVRAAVLDQISRDAPREVTAAWEAYFTDLAQFTDAAGTAPIATAAPVRSGRAIAGLDVDMVDEGTELTDELHVVDDVVTLCDMLAARGSVPPISVGLFGRWGSGKSYFMALMRRRIDELGRAAATARKEGRPTSYCSEVVQVTFNAWHYMDADDLWATLAVHLFNAIAQIDPDDDSARPRAEVVRDLEDRERQMEGVDRRITRALADDRLDQAAADMGLEAPRQDVLGLLHEIGTTIGYVSAGRVLLTNTQWTRRRRWSVVGLVVALAGLVAVAGLIISGTVPAEWLVAWVPPALTAGGTARKWLRGIKDGLAQVNRVAAESGLAPRDVTAERIANDGRIRALLDELDAIDRLASGRDWVRKRALSADYTSHFGVISVLRGDLEALVDKQRRDAPDRRIVLYIDDLDRCEPSRVVEVLQAVHLLLAFPLFVAVVGVDPRWLLRSLERHYRQVLSTSDGGARALDDLLTETTPQDYLEKIFQIPYSLRPMEPEGYGRLVAALAGPPAPAAGDGGTTREPASGAADRPVPPTDPVPTERVTGTASGPDPAAGADAPSVDRPPAPGHPTPPELAPVAADPPQLQVTADEVTALARMGPLIGTPRAAKRLVNLYRLIRAGLADDEVDRFVAEAQYRSLAIVLAVQVGFARVSTAFLTALVQGETQQPLTRRLELLAGQGPEHHDADGAGWESLRTGLRAVCLDEHGEPDPELDLPLVELRRWLPRLRRYSFEGALGGPAEGRRTSAEPAGTAVRGTEPG
jgi:hypothetical protein